jgi:hypothetical protein
VEIARGDDTVNSVDQAGTQNSSTRPLPPSSSNCIYTSVLGVTSDSPVPFLAAKAPK